MKVELLAPAGSYESLTAAVNAGADAVYVGGSRFGARAFANNLTEEKLLQAVDECHLRGKQLYLTVNTLLKDDEMAELYDYILPYYTRGLDAVIVQDMGVFTFLRREFPDLPIHASTQMTITGPDGAKLLKDLGASRIVTARELSLQEIAGIHKQVDIEIESFVHGALCYCYSGQCLYSSLIGGRSGNRGRCAQPCRLPYDLYQKGNRLNYGADKFLMSPKDMCTLDLIPELVESGVYSFKIEGRMKKPAYTAGVVRIYRKYIDLYLQKGRRGFHIEENDRLELMDLYNRGGFSTGYYKTGNGKEMMSLVRPNHIGTKAAKVVDTGKNILKLKAAEALHPGDVLECLDEKSGQKGTEFTMREEKKPGEVFQVKIPAGKKQETYKTIIRTRNEQLLKQLEDTFLLGKFKEKINGKLRLYKKNPAILELRMGDFAVHVTGDVVTEAMNQPLSYEKVKKQMQKTGNTPYIFEKLDIEMDNDIFLPVQSLNELRRMGLEQLTIEIQDSYRRNIPSKESKDEREINRSFKDIPKPVGYTYGDKGGSPKGPGDRKTDMKFMVSLESLDAFEMLLGLEEVTAIYLDSSAFKDNREFQISGKYIAQCHAAGKKCNYIMPYIFRSETRKYYESESALKMLAAYDALVVKSLDEAGYLKERGLTNPLIADYNLYAFNRDSESFFKEQGFASDTVPLELNAKEIEKRGCENSEILVYGHLPMMVSAQCLKKTAGRCNKVPEVLYLRDRMKKDFPVKTNCQFCYNVIYNSAPVVLLDNREEIRKLCPAAIRLSFTLENKAQVMSVTEKYIDAFCKGKNSRLDLPEFTRGHFKRGVE
ncbi:U32 family peptidase [Robinsoniella peoriensis]|uniref:U32 family peptidase n=1 Tax=Robinsoniella peoriensis TaxID=180332 RepID=UPI0009F697FC|nr:U32 family peptidase [Robinsoniella peoriensis]